MKFDRASFIREIAVEQLWDIIIIGGGATGLGVAVDAAARGFKTLLLEQADFAKGTSSRSTKLVHGGVRYLAQGNISLVYEALRERGLLFKNAPHLVKEQEFIIPCYGLLSKYKYLAGLRMYDLLAGNKGFNPAKYLNVNTTRAAIPGLKTEGLIGGVRYSDGQFDDARLALNLAQTCAEQGGVTLNYMKVTALEKSGEKVVGLKAVDLETGVNYTLKGKAIINATGVFVDEILQMDKPSTKPLVRPSQGVHVVVDSSFLNGDSALMIPKTDDGRVLFAVPWHGKLLLGTTDTPLEEHSLEPQALEKEIDFILRTAGQYLTKPPSRADVLSVYAGLRPLAAGGNGDGATKEISRSHKLIVGASGLITITGGKWTTYRKMAEDVVDKAVETAGLENVKCRTQHLAVHGYLNAKVEGELSVYGADAKAIENLIKQEPGLGRALIDGSAVTAAQVVWAVRREMARTVEDVLARRLRILFLDARLAINMAPAVAAIMAAELQLDYQWEAAQISQFLQLANRYLLVPYYPDIERHGNKIAI